jgi:hypothetical protein
MTYRRFVRRSSELLLDLVSPQVPPSVVVDDGVLTRPLRRLGPHS